MFICFFVYLAQYRNEGMINQHAVKICDRLAEGSFGGAEGGGYTYTLPNEPPVSFTCAEAMVGVHTAPRTPDRELERMGAILKRAGQSADAERLERQYREFEAQAPRYIDRRLWHDRSRLDLSGMLASSFAHGDWPHLIFNLIFFFAFAAAVEMVVGPLLFTFLIVALSYGIGFFDYGLATWARDPLPSLGLSGVVMGMLGLYAYLLPKVKIRFFYWFMFSVGTIGFPGWVVMAWYLGWDLTRQLSGTQSTTNYIAHISGAVLGVLLGLLLFRQKRHWAKEFVMDEADLTQDESWLAKLGALLAAPVMVILSFLTMAYVVVQVFQFFQHAWQLLLIVAFVLLGVYVLYRENTRLSGFRSYQRALLAMQNHSFDEALKLLAPLASRNDAKALHALGNLHLSANGTLRDPSKAAGYLFRAAKRGHAEAQHMLGNLLAEGHGVPPDLNKAMEWYAKAAQAGLPEAAMGLGHLYESDRAMGVDLPKAIEWYGKAGELYRKAGRKDDLAMILRMLKGFAPRNPEAQVWIERLKDARM